MLLDLAERGRSLGMVLVGAEQTASQVEERVVGRRESAEVARELYGWLGESLRRRVTLLQSGWMIVSQPQVPVLLVLSFPFPAWATRRSEVEQIAQVSLWPPPEPPKTNVPQRRKRSN